MYNCINYGCGDPLDDYNQNICDELIQGGLGAMIVLYCGSQITDPSSAAQINIELAAGRAKIIRGMMATIEAPTPIQIDPYVPCQTQTTVNYDRTGTYRNGNVSSGNDEFHNTLFAGKPFGGLILYNCSSDSSGNNWVDWIDEAVKFTGGKIIPANDNEAQRYEGTFAWRGINGPVRYAAPAGIF